jgi:hypothetical protein
MVTTATTPVTNLIHHDEAHTQLDKARMSIDAGHGKGRRERGGDRTYLFRLGGGDGGRGGESGRYDLNIFFMFAVAFCSEHFYKLREKMGLGKSHGS